MAKVKKREIKVRKEKGEWRKEGVLIELGARS
jgi:hypothetical protein